jgi:hypothetical protein
MHFPSMRPERDSGGITGTLRVTCKKQRPRVRDVGSLFTYP